MREDAPPLGTMGDAETENAFWVGTSDVFSVEPEAARTRRDEA
jgi:hypothetical protein